MIEFEGFEWDEANLNHATRHGISREEIEGALRAGFLETSSYISGRARCDALWWRGAPLACFWKLSLPYGAIGSGLSGPQIETG
jgi:hypothetical protein